MQSGTTEAINNQKFESFDIKLGNGWRYSFERRANGQIKVLEGRPGEKRKYIATYEFSEIYGPVINVVHQQSKPENEDFYSMAIAFFTMIRPNHASNDKFWKSSAEQVLDRINRGEETVVSLEDAKKELEND